MAIRDRLKVKTKDGDTTELEVTKQGGSIMVTPPNRGTPWLVGQVFDKNYQPSGETISIAESEIVYYVQDRAPLKKKG